MAKLPTTPEPRLVLPYAGPPVPRPWRRVILGIAVGIGLLILFMAVFVVRQRVAQREQEAARRAVQAQQSAAEAARRQSQINQGGQ